MVTRFGIGLLAVAAMGVAAGPAAAEPTAPPSRSVPVADPGLVPETGSAGAYNNLMCWLHTISADVPCRYT
ncbi:hypothetical protein [Nocardia arizonensis]|nr:hypothetical protein [Nocardia arizonensis]